ncbi:hypothetical protein BV341_05685 [Pseudomonas syringae pv. actinidiae]|nr:hypothetical protein BV341_05685 [Pseudomonas syringae pv. actinidiae]
MCRHLLRVLLDDALRSADVVLGPLIRQMQIPLPIQLGQVHPRIRKIVMHTGLIRTSHRLQKHMCRHLLRVLLDDAPHLLAKRLRRARLARMDPRHRSPLDILLKQALEDSHHRSSAHAHRDQHSRHPLLACIRGVKEELALGMTNLHLRALLHTMEQVGNQSRRTGFPFLPLDTNTIFLHPALLRRLAQAVLPTLQIPQLRDQHLHRHILARQILGQSGPIHGPQVKARNGTALLHLPRNPELPPPLPVVFLFILLVHASLDANKNVRQNSICRRPSVYNLGSRRIAQNLADGLDQVLADNSVLRRLDLERHVLVRNARDRLRERGKVVDVGGIGEDGVGEGARLGAGGLRGKAEDVFEGGVLRDEVVVEDGGDGFAVLLEDRGGGFDDGYLGVGEGHSE